VTRDRQIVAQCPRCLTLETLWFIGDNLVPTSRFYQGSDGKMYHRCGSSEPCHLFRGAVEVKNKKPGFYARTYRIRLIHPPALAGG